MTIHRGEVRWYCFPQPDKSRPVLILTRTPAVEFLAEITVAQITSTVRDSPSEVPLTKADGMPRDCVVNLDHVKTVPKARIGGLVTTLGAERMTAVRHALLFALGFDR